MLFCSVEINSMIIKYPIVEKILPNLEQTYIKKVNMDIYKKEVKQVFKNQPRFMEKLIKTPIFSNKKRL